MERLLELDDIMLVPAELNPGHQELKYDYSLKDPIDGAVSLPIFTSPMEAVVNETNWRVWQENGIRPVLPRTTDLGIRLEGCEYIFAAFSPSEIRKNFIDYRRNTQNQLRVCIDSGNGHDIDVLNLSQELKRVYGNQINIMAGNIGNSKTYIDYCKAGVDYVRVGLSSGSLVDRDKYGFYCPMASLLLDIQGLRKTSCVGLKLTKVIADGGIGDTVDIIKAIALGADYVMIGRQFARMLEGAGKLYRKFKDAAGDHAEELTASEVESLSRADLKSENISRLYCGNTSYEMQARRDGYDDVHDWTGKRKPCDSKVESVRVTLRLSSWLSEVLDIFSYGFTMAGATRWEEFKTKINICRIQ